MPEVRRLGGDPPSPWETAYGFSRLVVAGGLVMVGGTTSVDPTGVILGETPFDQTAVVLRRILAELARVGADAGDVVSTRAYVTDISRAGEVGNAFAEVFHSIRPLLTMVEVSALIDPRMLVEIEATAVLGPRAV